MKKRIYVLILSALILTGCSNKENKVKTENIKKETTNTTESIDPILEGDLKTEKEHFTKLKKEIYDAFEYTYSPDTEHNKGKGKIDLDGLKKYDKNALDSTFQTIEEIIKKCEKENRFFRKSEMEIIKFQSEEITRLTEKWSKYIESNR